MWVYFDSYLQLLHLHFLYLNIVFPLLSVKISLIFKFYCHFKSTCLRKKYLSFSTFLSWQILTILFEWLVAKKISKSCSVLKVGGGCYDYRFKLYKWLNVATKTVVSQFIMAKPLKWGMLPQWPKLYMYWVDTTLLLHLDKPRLLGSETATSIQTLLSQSVILTTRYKSGAILFWGRCHLKFDNFFPKMPLSNY